MSTEILKERSDAEDGAETSTTRNTRNAITTPSCRPESSRSVATQRMERRHLPSRNKHRNHHPVMSTGILKERSDAEDGVETSPCGYNRNHHPVMSTGILKERSDAEDGAETYLRIRYGCAYRMPLTPSPPRHVDRKRGAGRGGAPRKRRTRVDRPGGGRGAGAAPHPGRRGREGSRGRGTSGGGRRPGGTGEKGGKTGRQNPGA